MTRPRDDADAVSTLVIAPVPTTIVAFPLDDSSATFGLDRPLPLFGGDRLEPAGLPSAPGLDHVAGLRGFLADACRRQVLAGRAWHWHPPLGLIGAEGAGRGFTARRIADEAGVPLVEIDAEDLARHVERSAAGLRDAPPPALAMAACRCANPIVSVAFKRQLEDDDRVWRLLEGIADPVRNRRWLDENVGTVFDFGGASWIIQATRLPEEFAKRIEAFGRVLDAASSAYGDDGLRRLSVAVQVARSAGADRAAALAIHEALRFGFSGQARPSGRALVEHALATLEEFA